MSDGTDGWAEELKRSLEALSRIRDEARVQARRRFARLKRKLKSERRFLRRSVAELAANFRAFRDEVVRAARRSA